MGQRRRRKCRAGMAMVATVAMSGDDDDGDDVSPCFLGPGLNVTHGSLSHLILTAGWGGAPVINLFRGKRRS